MLVVIGTDCISSYKSNYHTITAMFYVIQVVWLNVSFFTILIVQENYKHSDKMKNKTTTLSEQFPLPVCWLAQSLRDFFLCTTFSQNLIFQKVLMTQWYLACTSTNTVKIYMYTSKSSYFTTTVFTNSCNLFYAIST